MPALLPTKYSGRIVWLGINDSREAGLRNRSVDALDLRFSGVVGESRSGLVRPSCMRVTRQYPRGTEIRNERQLCIMSAEELALVATDMGIPSLSPELLGVSILLDGIPDFSYIPPAARLQSESGATICVDMENRPCHLPAKVIDEDFPSGTGGRFKLAAKGRRGVMAWVAREGVLHIGDTITLHIPDQPVWPHLAKARGLTD